MRGQAVVSCHVESPLDDRVWHAFESLLQRRPGGFVVTPLLRPPHVPPARTKSCGSSGRVARRRWRRSGTTRTGAARHRRARRATVDAAAMVREEAAWFREHGLEPRFFCGGGWYLDRRSRRDARVLRVRRLHRDDVPAAVPGRRIAAAAAARTEPVEAPERRIAARASRDPLAGHARARAPSSARARPSALPRLGARAPRRALALAGLLAPAQRPPPAAPDRSARRAGCHGPGTGLGGGYDRPVTTEDVRATKPYLFSRSPLKTFARRLASTLALFTIDVAGLTLGLYAALALRSLVFDPKPILWGLLWDHERDWIVFLILLLALVFWRAGLYAPRETREGAGRIVPSVALVAGLALAFAVGTGQHFTTFGLYVVGAIFVSVLITVFRGSYEMVTARCCARPACAARSVLVGDDERARISVHRSARAVAASSTTSSARSSRGPSVEDALDRVLARRADRRRRGARRRAAARDRRPRSPPRRPGARRAADGRAPDRARRVRAGPGHSAVRAPPADLRRRAVGDQARLRSRRRRADRDHRPAHLARWSRSRSSSTSAGSVLYADPRGSAWASGVPDAEVPHDASRARPTTRRRSSCRTKRRARSSRSADDPRVTGVGRLLRKYSLDEVPNVINVLRGEMSLVGPRPLPVRDYERLEDWHRRRYNVLPGMTGLWQVAGRSDLTFDDLVRLDFYYIENWSIWLDMSILLKTPFAVFNRKGAYWRGVGS